MEFFMVKTGFCITYSVPYALISTRIESLGLGQGLSMGVLNLAIVIPQLPEERKVYLLKNLAECSPYVTPQDSRQLLPSVVQLLKPEEAERDWFAFVLYSVKRLSETNADDSQGTGGDGFTLCQILRVAKLNIVDFFKELPQFIVKAGQILSNQYGTDWEKILEVNQLGVVISVQVVPQQEKCSNALLVAWTCLQMPIHNRA